MLKPSDKFNTLNKLYKKRLIPADQYETEIPYVYEEAMERNLTLHKISPYYDIDTKIETVYGRYSNVLNYHSKDGKTFSLRLIKKKDEGLYESEWQNMKHKNILTILSRKSYEEEEAICYLSPYVQNTLKQVITSEAFRHSKQAAMFLQKWLKDVAEGLHYIHSKNFAHSNITTNNILIQDTLMATITDFHFLNTSNKASNSIGLKYSHRPPESFLNGDGTSSVDCTKLDVWSLGLLAINIFTGLYMEKKLPDDVTYWSKDVYSHIFKVLKKKKFNKLHKKHLKHASASDILKSARSFSAFCLGFDPIERPAVKDLLGHDLMNKSGFRPKKDKMWNKKVHWEKIEKQISLLKDCQGSDEDLDVVLDVEPSQYLENENNSNVIENTISLASKINLEFEGQNRNIEEFSGMKKELTSQVIDTKENPPNCHSGDAEINMLILDDEITYEKETISGTSQEDKNADIKSECDRLADLLLSLSKIRHHCDDSTDEEDLNVKEQQPKKQVENTEISENIENMKTTLDIEDKQNTDYFSIASKTEMNSEGDLLADLLISLPEFHVHSTKDEEENIVIADENIQNQNENILSEKNTTELQKEIKTTFEIQDSVKDTITEEIQIFSPQIQQLKPEEKIKKGISAIDFQKEKKAEKAIHIGSMKWGCVC